MVFVLAMRSPREILAKPDGSQRTVKLGVEQEPTIKPDGMSVMTLTERPRQTRARAPRARTGCKQCKRRHIKCDEGKPSCQRCLIGGRVCEWLAYSGMATALPKPKTQYDKVTDRVCMRKDELWQLLKTAVPSAVSDNLFANAKEWDHFQFFIRMGTPYETLPEGSLQLLTPQVAHLVPAVKEVCCAVGALSKTMSTSGKAATEALADSTEHYSRAVVLLRSCVPTNDSLLSVCVASLMFTTYEMLAGTPEVAFSHYRHACLIFEQYLAKRSEDAGIPFADLRLSTYPWTSEIHQVETPTMNSRLMSCCKGQLYTSLLFRMPTSFDLMTTAIKWWDATQHFVMHHSHQGRTGGAAEQKMWEQCVDTLHNWHANFHSLFENSRREYYRDNVGKAERYSQGLMLETLYLESLGSISKYHMSDANILPATKPLFHEILNVTRARILAHGSFSDESTTTEKLLLRPLAFVLVKCDAPDIVQEIQDLLMAIDKPGHIGRALLGILGADIGEKPLGSAMFGWMWDFLTSGCAVVSLTVENQGRLGQNWKSQAHLE
ncbi:hypothetical protein NLU13_9906 [Sarocladium strictum]|uniref:Zn(2)-C6 fungal-type domain-containing protein n=1 Tax=Sarocladium strictum TaxID=5046 RepID=A0AA39G9A1_SARSR|nr:hypothetical protein NLU13_9906 [Sarocladium strictum]